MLVTAIARALRRYRWALNLAFIFACSWSLAGAVNAVVAQKLRGEAAAPVLGLGGSTARGPSRRALKNNTEDLSYASIAIRNLLGAMREDLHPQPVRDESVEAPPVEEELATDVEFDEAELKACSLPISVRATLVSTEHPRWSTAVVYNNKEREAQVVSINADSNAIGDEATVVAIRKREIIAQVNDQFQRCTSDADKKKKGKGRRGSSFSRPTSPKYSSSSSDSGGGVTKMSETEYEIEKEEIDRVLGNLSEVATKARIVPSFKNGKPNGFKLFSIKPGSIYAKIGMKNGDVVRKVNGYEMNSPDKALEIYQKLKDARSVTIDIQRRGRAMTMNYDIGR